MIELSVALPLFNSKKIAWLALESLCRQEGINFRWELVVIEEQENSFGAANIHEYSERLKNVGCDIITYISLRDWMPLGKKWRLLAENCNSNSQAFVLQAADCYSEPKRLKTTYEKIVKEDYGWMQNTKGLFFNIRTKKHILYNAVQQCGLNMATKPQLIRNINIDEVSKHVDGSLFRSIRPKKVANIISEDYKNGVDTHGLNNISIGRETYFDNTVFPFEETDLNIKNFLPEDITTKLYNL